MNARFSFGLFQSSEIGNLIFQKMYEASYTRHILLQNIKLKMSKTTFPRWHLMRTRVTASRFLLIILNWFFNFKFHSFYSFNQRLFPPNWLLILYFELYSKIRLRDWNTFNVQLLSKKVALNFPNSFIFLPKFGKF